MLFGTVYRKPSSKAANDKLIRDAIDVAADSSRKILICGDFNHPEINWKDNTVNASAFSPEMRFFDCLEDNFLQQHVTKPTRFRGKDKPSTVDLIISENSQTQIEPIHEVPLDKSDHVVLKWSYLLGVTESENVTNNEPVRKNYYKGRYKDMKKDCEDINWTNELLPEQYQSTELSEIPFQNLNLNEMLEKLYDKVENLVNIHVPDKSTTNKKQQQPWMTRKSLKQIKKKYHSWKRFQASSSGNYKLYLDYIKQRDKSTKLTRDAKKEYERKIAKDCKNNPKAFYKYCNWKAGKKSQHIRLHDEAGNFQTSDLDNANLLNRYFASVFTEENDKKELIFNAAAGYIFNDDISDPFEFKDKAITQVEDMLPDIDITMEDVYTLLRQVDPNKSSAAFCIHPRILKELSEELTLPIYLIFLCSLKQGKVPDKWKVGTITPLHKGDNRHVPKNYRPVTITSKLCRILETIIKQRLISHLTENNILCDNQHGFRCGRSCTTNLLETLEYITEMYDKGIAVDEIFLDFSKAFDKVPHQRLLFKLKKYGIQDNTLAWIESFLNNRFQNVKVKNTLSKTLPVISGVPQGSVLGPVLFLLYINDLPNYIHCKSSIFADDSKIYSKIQSMEDSERLQDDLNNLVEWSRIWMMSFNTDKCHVMHFTDRNPLFIYTMGGRLLQISKTEKDLGVLISNNLKSDEHIDYCVKKAYKVLGMIKRTFVHVDKDIFLNVYKTFIRPILEYGQSAWSPYLQKDIDKIELVQRRATKLVFSLRELSYEERLSQLGLYSLESRRKRGDMILMYKLLHDKLDIRYESTFFRPMDCNQSVNTRSHKLKVIPCHKSKTGIGYNRFSNRVIVSWNSLPDKVVNSPNVDTFKRNYDDHLNLSKKN